MYSNIVIYCVNVHNRVIHPKLFFIAKPVFLGHDSSHSKGEINHTLKMCFSPLTAEVPKMTSSDADIHTSDIYIS